MAPSPAVRQPPGGRWITLDLAVMVGGDGSPVEQTHLLDTKLTPLPIKLLPTSASMDLRMSHLRIPHRIP